MRGFWLKKRHAQRAVNRMRLSPPVSEVAEVADPAQWMMKTGSSPKYPLQDIGARIISAGISKAFNRDLAGKR